MTGSEDAGQLTIGFSPCPNDTFIFHDFVHGLASKAGLNFADPQLADVESLNRQALTGRLDVTKLSFHALGRVLDEYVLLQSGAALGRGCGPLLVSPKKIFPDDLPGRSIAIPGELTTAAMLLRLFEPECTRLAPMSFERIIPSLVAGEVEAGVIIHESRFTYGQYGLEKIVDLGAWWEERTGMPIPLGGIAARRSLGAELINRIDQTIHQSIRNAILKPELSGEYIKKHAQELNEQVIHDHISLYVNDFTSSLGGEGERAVELFLLMGRKAGLFSQHSAAGILLKNGL